MPDDPSVAVLGGRLHVHHAPDSLRTCLDTLMLAAACPAQENARILDLGCGIGAAGLAVLCRLPQARLVGVDIRADLVDIARQNAQANSFAHRASFHQENALDFRGLAQTLSGEGFGTFDDVICNPPFLDPASHSLPDHKGRAIALGHDPDKADSQKEPPLHKWVYSAFQSLRIGGTLTIIHRAAEIDALLRALNPQKRRFGGIEIIPLWPHTGQPAKRVLVRAVRGRRTPLIFHAGIVLHDPDGTYTPRAENVLRHGQPLTL